MESLLDSQVLQDDDVVKAQAKVPWLVVLERIQHVTGNRMGHFEVKSAIRHGEVEPPAPKPKPKPDAAARKRKRGKQPEEAKPASELPATAAGAKPGPGCEGAEGSAGDTAEAAVPEGVSAEAAVPEGVSAEAAVPSAEGSKQKKAKQVSTLNDVTTAWKKQEHV